MEDRELLELAAKAAGINGTWCQFPGMVERHGFDGAIYDEVECEYWNPLQDDGDALRLAVKLSLTLRLNQFEEWTQAFTGDCYARLTPAVSEHVGRTRQEQTIEQATRRAIVRAAAEIGKSMEDQH